MAGKAVCQSQSSYGAMWFATLYDRYRDLVKVVEVSQSPCGAKWFATGKWVPESLEERYLVAIPLRG